MPKKRKKNINKFRKIKDKSNLLNTKEYKLTLISWIDAYGVEPRWVDIDEETTDSLHIISVGYITKEDDEYLIICPHIQNCNTHCDIQGCGQMAIPKCSVIERIEI